MESLPPGLDQIAPDGALSRKDLPAVPVGGRQRPSDRGRPPTLAAGMGTTEMRPRWKT
jgi:hypothetical protein